MSEQRSSHPIAPTPSYYYGLRRGVSSRSGRVRELPSVCGPVRPRTYQGLDRIPAHGGRGMARESDRVVGRSGAPTDGTNPGRHSLDQRGHDAVPLVGRSVRRSQQLREVPVDTAGVAVCASPISWVRHDRVDVYCRLPRKNHHRDGRHPGPSEERADRTISAVRARYQLECAGAYFQVHRKTPRRPSAVRRRSPHHRTVKADLGRPNTSRSRSDHGPRPRARLRPQCAA